MTAHLPQIDQDDVEAALGAPVSSYVVEPIDPHLRIHSVTGGVFRVRAQMRSGLQRSLVVKIVLHADDEDPGALWVAGADTSHRNYWKREWCAFDSGVLDELPGLLTAPRCIATHQQSPTECWIWMEDVAGRTGAELALDDYARIGFALGTTQGTYSSGNVPLPSDDWLSREWLRGWVGACARFIDVVHEESLWRDDRLASLRALRPRVLQLWSAKESLLAIVDAALPTLVHCDFWPTNIFVSDDRVAAIDWSQIGIGRIAQDLDQLTLDPIWMQVRPAGSARELEQVVLPSYVEGLLASGCDADLDEVRLRYAAAAAVHFAWMAGAHALRCANADEVAFAEQRWGRSFTDISADRARVIEHAIELGEWALGSVA